MSRRFSGVLRLSDADLDFLNISRECFDDFGRIANTDGDCLMFQALCSEYMATRNKPDFLNSLKDLIDEIYEHY
jgi:hypothetical protein